MTNKTDELSKSGGLTNAQVNTLRSEFGRNIYQAGKSRRLLHIITGIIREPMFILLATACVVYFILDKRNEGFLMMFAILIVSAVAVFQEVRSSFAVRALEQLTEPLVNVLRDNIIQKILTADLVPGDLVFLEEGNKVPADLRIISSNDLSVSEAILTGESIPVDKSIHEGRDLIFQGTSINTGKCSAVVLKTGRNTELGKIGKSIEGFTFQKPIIQQRVEKLIRRLAIIGILAFITIFVLNYFHYRDFVSSLLFALTLAMTIIPEEIPVAFSTFLALGAYRLSKHGIISRTPQVIENLSFVDEICLDKTGTITENKMKVRSFYNYSTSDFLDLDKADKEDFKELLFYAVLASERDPFDPMEQALQNDYKEIFGAEDWAGYSMIHEYPLSGKPPMMTHVYAFHDQYVVAGKGAAEKVLQVCKIGDEERVAIQQIANDMASEGCRVLGIAKAERPGQPFPETQENFTWAFEGLLSFYDPPKKNMEQVIHEFQNHGLNVRLLTGDYHTTASAISKMVGIKNANHYLTGDDVMKLPEQELIHAADEIYVFARMFPEAKLKLITVLKADNRMVVMTGDGVNDGPALKAADIGIAMGSMGSQIARDASDLILSDNDVGKILAAIAEGKRIYSNLEKAFLYIIKIHLPIILTALVPVILNWKFPNIFTPIHVVFLELIMGPTCSIFFENEPVEEQTEKKKPDFLNRNQLAMGVLQGVIFGIGILSLYKLSIDSGYSLGRTRTLVFTALIFGNLLLTFTGRSFTNTIDQTIRYKNNLAKYVFAISILFMLVLNFSSGAGKLFGLEKMSTEDWIRCLLACSICILWIEIYKHARNVRRR